MSATLSGLIVLENPRPVEESALSVTFDGQIWLGPGRILTGIFRYYNSSNLSFPDVGQYFAWIHVAKFIPLGQSGHTNVDVDSEREKARQLKEWHTVEDAINSDGSSASETLGEPDVVHVVGDIIQLIPTKTDDLRQKPYINVSGAALNSNKADGYFEINAPQYTSHYKTNRAQSILPVQAHFNSNKYRTRKPIPSNNTYVSIEGFLEDVETDTSGCAMLFRVSVDNINFLGKAVLSTSTVSAGNPGPTTPSRSSCFKFNFNDGSPNSSTDVSNPTTPTPNTSATPPSEEGTLTRTGKRRK
ncbi:hypothetical protein V8E52_010320 [Russula decolorans]|jgi:hypothetical protein